MTKLVALVDGSIYSKSVCDHAAWIAKRLEVGVELLHVLGRRQTSSAPADRSGAIALGARSALLAELSEHDAQTARLAQKRGRAILEDAEAILREDGVAEVSARLRHEDLLDAVREVEAEAEMVVIGKRGEAADFAAGHLGSNLERIARATTRPLFVASREFRPIENALIAFDGGTSAMKAVDHIARSTLFEGLKLRVVMVGAEATENRRKLEGACAILKGAGHTVEAELTSGQPDRVIAERVEAGGVGLLAMGAYGHSPIRNLIIGSTTTKMVRECRVPVMLFR